MDPRNEPLNPFIDWKKACKWLQWNDYVIKKDKSSWLLAALPIVNKTVRATDRANQTFTKESGQPFTIFRNVF